MSGANRATHVDQKLREAIKRMNEGPRRADLDGPIRPGSLLSGREAIRIFESQVTSRHLDLVARELRARGEGFYTIASAGHEGNAAVAAALRPTDPAFLHYRSGGFFVQRARMVPGQDPVRDVLLGLVASSEDPIAGGRHKVFGSRALEVPPQTSTIASHLPKAVGAAITLDRMRRLGLEPGAAEGSIVLCSFGDASLNHSTAVGAINAALWCAYRSIPVPLMLLCEDNGIGISVTTPEGWVERAAGRPGLHVRRASGLDLVEAFDAASEVADWVRRTRRPALLHLETVRLLGHAGSDYELAYRTPAQVEAAEARDPLVASARLLVVGGLLGAAEALELYDRVGEEVRREAERAVLRPRLASAEEILAPLAPRDDEAVAREVAREPSAEARRAFWGGALPEEDKPRHLAALLNRALGDLLVAYPSALVFGEDVSSKGGVYHVTADLARRAGVGRVFDTLLDEQAILGMALGAGQMGCLPIPEIQYLAYLHNAADQIRGEAATLQFFSRGQFRNPMVVRVASYAYQKGFGGHFHNDNSVAALRDIPGVVVASPARGDDAVHMLRTAAAAARVSGAVVLFLEPIALYMTRDLHEEGDGLWSCPYPAPGPSDEHVSIGAARVHGDGGDLTIVTFANGLYMSLRVARRLEARGVRARVLDLRWLSPLPEEDIVREVEATGRVLVVDETRRSGAVSDSVVALLVDRRVKADIRRVTSRDSFVPLGEAARHVLLSEDAIEAAALEF